MRTVRKATGTTPQARSLKHLRDAGYFAETVEKWKRFPDRGRHKCHACGNMPMIQVRVDLWNFADIFAFHPVRREVWLIQVTTSAHAAERETKMRNHPEASKAVLGAILAGVRVGVHSWAKRGAEGSRKLWTVDIREMLAGDMPVAAHAAMAADGVKDTGAQESMAFESERDDMELMPAGD